MSKMQQFAALNAERAELLRKMQWQAGCMASEGKTSEQINAATQAKMTRYEAINAEIVVLRPFS